MSTWKTLLDRHVEKSNQPWELEPRTNWNCRRRICTELSFKPTLISFNRKSRPFLSSAPRTTMVRQRAGLVVNPPLSRWMTKGLHVLIFKLRPSLLIFITSIDRVWSQWETPTRSLSSDPIQHRNEPVDIIDDRLIPNNGRNPYWRWHRSLSREDFLWNWMESNWSTILIYLWMIDHWIWPSISSMARYTWSKINITTSGRILIQLSSKSINRVKGELISSSEAAVEVRVSYLQSSLAP